MNTVHPYLMKKQNNRPLINNALKVLFTRSIKGHVSSKESAFEDGRLLHELIKYSIIYWVNA